MEDLFKQKLLGLIKPTLPTSFTEALMGKVNWVSRKPESEKPSVEVFTEKAQVLESLERFALEKMKTETVLKVPGGEVALKVDPSWEGISDFDSLEKLIHQLSLPSEILNLNLNHKKAGAIDILFVSESFRPYQEILKDVKEDLSPELLAAFPSTTAGLFGRMLGAMKLPPQEMIIYPSELEEKDLSLEVMQVATYFRPKLIVTLGAKATNKVLKSQERLAMVHGQFFNRKVENRGSFTIVPLFHPSIIESNQNMKKTAWADMQKIMKHLKKIP